MPTLLCGSVNTLATLAWCQSKKKHQKTCARYHRENITNFPGLLFLSYRYFNASFLMVRGCHYCRLHCNSDSLSSGDDDLQRFRHLQGLLEARASQIKKVKLE